MENILNEAEIPEISETGEEKGLSDRDLQGKYISLAYSRFVRNPPVLVVNHETNWLIELSSRVIKEWRAKSRTRERIISIQLLDTIIEKAKFLKTVKDAKNTPGIADVSYFESLCKINGRLFRINITVKRIENRRFAYYYSALGLK
ncbi:MAG: hypothetical protein LBK40_07265 [Spirochaetaceae bacterium]|nr:hypothetical protein [Spirochaetaceae bacterium]